jgi:hypothetical protein
MDAASYAGNDFRAMRTLTRKTILEFFARNPILRAKDWPLEAMYLIEGR